ncbi:hypothetical protein MMU07_21620 [Aquiflexum sp. LQ15W]|uniref:hypothetical protein n=1 Tax=Cognataquiflexum nitidum TaxID=2922272 RepID=UPI001F1368FB|nr:hypothetical protein [Cognataquiflexum nitidum]MCH6202191.1 hypothetical protein [Cognataquiflexum nitidum]
MKLRLQFIVGLFLISQSLHALQTYKNTFELSTFNITSANTTGFERTSTNGISLGYTRYFFERLNVGASVGWGDFYGRGSILLERFDDFPENRRDYTQWQLKLGYDLIQTERLNLGVQAEYLRFYYNGITERFTVGSPDDPEFLERLTFGRLAAPSFFIGPYGMFHLTEKLAVKGEAVYGMPSMNFEYTRYRVSLGLGFRF